MQVSPNEYAPALLLANLAHHPVIDPAVDRTFGPEDLLSSAARTNSGVRRDESTAPLSPARHLAA
jgi:hypothetical protein